MVTISTPVHPSSFFLITGALHHIEKLKDWKDKDANRRLIWVEGHAHGEPGGQIYHHYTLAVIHEDGTYWPEPEAGAE